MHDDGQQQGSLVRPPSRLAWLFLGAVALAVAALVLLGHDPAGAETVGSDSDSGTALTMVTSASATTVDATSPLGIAPSGDSWTTWWSSLALPTVSTAAGSSPQNPSPPADHDPSSGHQKEERASSANRGRHRSDAASHARDGDEAPATADGTGTDEGLAGAGAGAGTGAAIVPVAASDPLFGSGQADPAGASPAVDGDATTLAAAHRRPAASGDPRSAASQSGSSTSPSSRGPAGSDPAPTPLPAAPCPASGGASIGSGGTSSPAATTAVSSSAAHQFTLRRTTSPRATAAGRDADGARAANGSRGPPNERAR